jgi:amyloid beta precursor protein binding protein 1
MADYGSYQDKAAADAAAVEARVKATLAKIGKPENFISSEEVKKFCKNSLFLQVIRYRSLEEEYSASTAKASTIGNCYL